MLSNILRDSKIIPKTIGYKVTKGLATLADEEEVYTNPKWAYRFAGYIPGANIEKCQESACTNPEYAYCFAKHIPGADKEKCQEAACKDPGYAYYFALDIPGADIEKCQEAACKNPEYAYMFARDVPGANIEKCQEAACKSVFHAYVFAQDIPGADIKKCQEAVHKDFYCKKCGYKEGADLNASKNIRDLWNKFYNPERAGCSQSPECLPTGQLPSWDLTSPQASPVGS